MVENQPAPLEDDFGLRCDRRLGKRGPKGAENCVDASREMGPVVVFCR